MKKIKLILFVLLLVILVLLGAGWLYKGHILKKASPTYSGEISLNTLKENVEVYWDSIGVPHIFASNEADLYFITGYISAQERLWQMDLLRRVTTGRLSEIFGKEYTNTDLLLRMLRISEKSRKILETSDSSVINAFQAFSDGVNKYIDDHKDALPPEFFILGYKPESWLPEHSVNLIGYIAWDLNGSWNSEILLHKMAAKLAPDQCRSFIPDYGSTLAVIYPVPIAQNYWGDEMLKVSDKLKGLGAQIFHGSNNWAVSGTRAANGKPMLANDMHLGYSVPGTWFQIHQVVPGKLDVTGVMVPGQPFVVSGHNQRIAWGLTNVMNDDIDFYKETIHPQDTNSYKYDGKWLKMTLKPELIKIKGEKALETTIRYTHRGPVISGMKGVSDEVISMHWLGNEMSNEVRSIYLVNKAVNWDQFKDAMKTFISVSQNAAYADVDGNIGLYCCAGIPIRKAGNPITILPGDTSLYDWKGLVPFDELPHSYNPANGFVVSANNKTIGSSFPHYISNWFDLPYRYNRIHELLNNDSSITTNDFAAIQTDFTSGMARMYLPTLIEVLNSSKNLDNISTIALDSLKHWDGRMLSGSASALIFEVFFNTFAKNLVADELGDTLYNEFLGDKILFRHTFHNTLKNRGSVLCDNVKTKPIETLDMLVSQTFKEVVIQLSEEYGNNPASWAWGDKHIVTFEHPLGTVKILDRIFGLNRGPYPANGSSHTVAPYTYKYNKAYKVSSGASQRHVYDLGNWDNSYSVIPTGNSGLPASEFYCNQTPLYLEGKYHHDWFSKDIIAKHYKYRIVYKPVE